METTLWGHLHLWSLKTSTGNDDIGLHTYHEKTSGTSDGICRLSSRQKWAESRKITWTLKNKRPEKLKDHLNEVEELLQTHRIAQVKWRNPRFVQVLLRNSTIISFVVSKNSGDVEKIFTDKSLCGKLTDRVYTGIWTEWFMLLSFCDKSKICFINFARKFASDFKKLEKLVALEPKITYLDLPGHAGRRLNRHLTLNSKQNMVGIWWSAASEDAWPWSPVAGDRARANIVVLGVNGGKVDVLGCLRTESDPIHASFSFQNPHHILTIESTPKNADDNSVDCCIYEFNNTNMARGVLSISDSSNKFVNSSITRISATTILLKAAVSCQAWNQAEDKLLLGCKDKSLVLFDCHRLLTQKTIISFIPSKIQWHPAGSVVFVFSIDGDIQVFDMALAPILLQLSSENPRNSPIFRMSQYITDVKLAHAVWSCDNVPLHTLTDGSVDCHDNLFLVFQDRGLLCNLRIELGSLTLGRLGPRELIEEYIKHNQAMQAVNFVNSINWNTDGSTCFACLSAVMNYLLKFPLTDEREGLLEETLGCFYTPSRPLTDVTVLQFRDPLSRWTRRFFYHLLRYKRFQKAFMLAVDIGAADLFMDIHFVAMDAGDVALAENAKNKALEIDNELISTETDDSSESEENEGSLNTQEEPEIYQEPPDTEEDVDFEEPQEPRVLLDPKGYREPESNKVVALQNRVDDIDAQPHNIAVVENSNSNVVSSHANITHDPAVWELANNIELVTTENEGEDVIYL